MARNIPCTKIPQNLIALDPSDENCNWYKLTPKPVSHEGQNEKQHIKTQNIKQFIKTKKVEFGYSTQELAKEKVKNIEFQSGIANRAILISLPQSKKLKIRNSEQQR